MSCITSTGLTSVYKPCCFFINLVLSFFTTKDWLVPTTCIKIWEHIYIIYSLTSNKLLGKCVTFIKLLTLNYFLYDRNNHKTPFSRGTNVIKRNLWRADDHLKSFIVTLADIFVLFLEFSCTRNTSGDFSKSFLRSFRRKPSSYDWIFTTIGNVSLVTLPRTLSLSSWILEYRTFWHWVHPSRVTKLNLACHSRNNVVEWISCLWKNFWKCYIINTF